MAVHGNYYIATYIHRQTTCKLKKKKKKKEKKTTYITNRNYFINKLYS